MHFKIRKLAKLSLLLLTLCSASPSLHSETVKLVTNDFKEIADRVLQKIETDKLNPSDVLIVTDIDSTLISLNQTLGSEGWFQWQESFLKSDTTSPYRIGRSFADLLAQTKFIYALTKVHPVQNDEPAIVRNLQDRGIKVVCLTARGPGQLDDTLRNLGQAGYDFRKSSVGQARGYGYSFLPYDLKDLAVSGITESDLQRLEIKGDPKPVSFSQGIFLSEGQNKGLMLKILLNKTRFIPKLVVFIDNQEKHVTRVSKAMEGETRFDTWSIIYSRANENPNKPGDLRALSNEEQDRATQDWQKLKSTIDAVFPNAQ